MPFVPDDTSSGSFVPDAPATRDFDLKAARVKDNTADYPLLQAMVSGANKAALDLAGAPVGLWNLGHEGMKYVTRTMLGDNSGDRVIDALLGPEASKYTPAYFEQQANARGVPTEVPDPTSAAQRYSGAIGSGAIGGVPGVVSSIAQQAAADAGTGPGVQLAAGLLGAATPAGLKAGTQKLLGMNPATAGENIARVEGVGAQPTVGMAAGPGSNAQALESIVSGAPGGAGIMARKLNEANAAAGRTMEDIASNLSAGGVTDTQAGATVQSALGGNLPGKTNYLQKIRDVVGKAYDARDAAVPQGTAVDVSGFLARVQKLSKEDPAFESYIQNDPVFTRIQKNLADGSGAQPTTIGGRPAWLMPGGKVSFTPPVATTRISYQDAAIAQRALNQLVDSSYMFGSTTSQVNGSLAQAAKAMAQDVSSTLETIPGAKALDARARAIWQQGEDAKEHLKGILSAATGPQAMDALLAGSDRGSTVLDTAMRGLSVPQQNMVTGAVVQKLGRAVRSAQDASGGVWSANTFLMNWNKLDDDAKAVLFRNMPDSYRQNLDQFAKYAENVKASKAVYANPSGTANRTAALVMGGTAALGAAKGAGMALVNPVAGAATVATALFPIIAASGSAKLLTYPPLVRWLAASTKLPMSSLPVVANQLTKLGQQQNDPEIAGLAQQLQQASKQQ